MMALSGSLCRLCTKNSNATSYLDDIDTDKVKFIDKLKFVFNDVVLEEDNETSFLLCPTCRKKLIQTYDFKKQCVNSFEYWQVHIHKMKFINKGKNSIKEEPAPTPSPAKKRGRPRKIKPEESNQVIDLNSILKPSSIESSLNAKNRPVLKPNNSKNKLDTPSKSNDSLALKPDIFNLKNKLNMLLKPENVIKRDVEVDENVNKSRLSKSGKEIEKEEKISKNVANLLKSENEIRREVEINKNVDKPILLNLFSLKSKLEDALKIGAQNFENEKVKQAKKRPTKKYFVFNKMVYIVDLNDKTFYCTSCGKCFSNLRSLKIHIIQDLGIKNVPCKFCKRRFFSYREQKIHMQTHTIRS